MSPAIVPARSRQSIDWERGGFLSAWQVVAAGLVRRDRDRPVVFGRGSLPWLPRAAAALLADRNPDPRLLRAPHARGKDVAAPAPLDLKGQTPVFTTDSAATSE